MLSKQVVRILRPMTYLFTGPMEAGKTYHLMRTVQDLLGTATPAPFESDFSVDGVPKHDQGGFTAAVFCKPIVDTRTDSSTIASRNGTMFHGVAALSSLDTVVLKENTLVAVDEAQFFDESLLRLFDRVQQTTGCTMVIAGLDRDYEKKPFGHVLELAHKIVMSPGMGQVNLLRAPCHIAECRSPASYTKRLVQGKGQIFIGSTESYVAACAEHHQEH